MSMSDDKLCKLSQFLLAFHYDYSIFQLNKRIISSDAKSLLTILIFLAETRKKCYLAFSQL